MTFQIIRKFSGGGFSYAYVDADTKEEAMKLAEKEGDKIVEKEVEQGQWFPHSLTPLNKRLPLSMKVVEYDRKTHKAVKKGETFTLRRAYTSATFTNGRKVTEYYYNAE